MLQIDIRTLFITSGTVAAVLGGLMAYVQATEKTYPGFPDWMVAAICQAVGFLLFTTGRLSPTMGVAANVLLILSADRFLRGAQRFVGQQGRPSWDELAVYATSLATFCYFDFVDRRFDARVVIFSLTVCYVCVKALVSARRCAWDAYRTDARFLTSLVTLVILVHLGRAVTGMWLSAGGTELRVRALPEMLALLASVAVVVCLVGVFLKLTAKRLRLDLEAARGQVRQLEGIITICMYCKRIRDDADSWRMLEHYMAEHSTAQFSHGLCPECEARVSRT